MRHYLHQQTWRHGHLSLMPPELDTTGTRRPIKGPRSTNLPPNEIIRCQFRVVGDIPINQCTTIMLFKVNLNSLPLLIWWHRFAAVYGCGSISENSLWAFEECYWACSGSDGLMRYGLDPEAPAIFGWARSLFRWAIVFLPGSPMYSTAYQVKRGGSGHDSCHMVLANGFVTEVDLLTRRGDQLASSCRCGRCHNAISLRGGGQWAHQVICTYGGHFNVGWRQWR